MDYELVINADDYGLAKNFNKGIIELIRRDVVTSVSVMVNRTYATLPDLLVFENLSIGLHLELEEKTATETIEAQIHKFKRLFTALPSHLDGHQHCHIFPENILQVAAVAQKYNLPVRSRSFQDREILRAHGVKTPDLFIGWHPTRKERMFSELRNPTASVAEFVCHPGYFDSNTDHPYNQQREDELKILPSSAFAEIISQFKLISYYEL